MDEDNLIYALVPETWPAYDACHEPHNKLFLSSDSSLCSRQVTPATWDGNDDPGFDNTELQFTYDQGIKIDWDYGSASIVTVLLLNVKIQKSRKKLVSRHHFSIGFADKDRLFVYQNPKAPAITVTYDGKPGEPGGPWVLKPGPEIKIIVHRGLIFKVRVPHHDPVRLRSYLQECSTALPPIEKLNFDSQPTTVAVSEATTRGQGVRYFIEGEIGKGQFGVVHMAWNVHTGDHCALKDAYENINLRYEISILRSVSHERVIQLIDYDDAGLFFCLEFLPSNLTEEHQRSPFTREEIEIICWQIFEGLRHIHSKGVIVRDIKPETFRLSYRNPLSIKFADLEVATNIKCSADFLIHPNPRYGAPELFNGKAYTKKTDIWSCGLVLFEILVGLRTSQPLNQRAWYQYVFEWIEQNRRKYMVEFLSGSLQEEPRNRPSAEQCVHDLEERGPYEPSESTVQSPAEHHGSWLSPIPDPNLDPVAYNKRYPIELLNPPSRNHSLPSTLRDAFEDKDPVTAFYSSRRYLSPGIRQQERAGPVHAGQQGSPLGYEQEASVNAPQKGKCSTPSMTSSSVRPRMHHKEGILGYSTSHKSLPRGPYEPNQAELHESWLSPTPDPALDLDAYNRRLRMEYAKVIGAIPRPSPNDSLPATAQVSEDEDDYSLQSSTELRQDLGTPLVSDYSLPPSKRNRCRRRDEKDGEEVITRSSLFASLLAHSSQDKFTVPCHPNTLLSSQFPSLYSTHSGNAKHPSLRKNNGQSFVVGGTTQASQFRGSSVGRSYTGIQEDDDSLEEPLLAPSCDSSFGLTGEPLVSADDPSNSRRHTSFVVESTSQESHGTNARSTSLLDTKQEVISPLKTEETPGYLTIMAPEAPNPKYFLIRTEDSKLCLTKLLQMAGYTDPEQRRDYVRRRKQKLDYSVSPLPGQGARATWVDIQIGVAFCNSYLPDVAPDLELTLQELGYLPDGVVGNFDFEEDPDADLYTCTYPGCECRFPTRYKMLNHRTIEHPRKSDKRLKCDKVNLSTGTRCNLVFTRTGDLTRHENTIHNIKKEIFRCQWCNKSYSRKDALRRHIRGKHPDEL